MGPKPADLADGPSVRILSECAICQMVSSPPRTGWIYADDTWVVGALPGLEVPGWIVVALRRHAVGAAPLTEPESAGLGTILAPVSAALADATNAERIYLQAYGEREPHFHLLLSARGSEVPMEHRHVQFFLNREAYIDPDRAHQVVERVRENLASLRSTTAAGLAAATARSALFGDPA